MTICASHCTARQVVTCVGAVLLLGHCGLDTSKRSEEQSSEEPAQSMGGEAVTTDEPPEAEPPWEPTPDEPCSPEGRQLIELVNDYRQDNGLSRIPLSPSLCLVAQVHVEDLVTYRPYAEDPDCDLPSWSEHTDAMGCCYRTDQTTPECMWEKPRELTDYPGLGYESVAVNTQSPEQAVELFKSDPAHGNVLLEVEPWDVFEFRAIGAAYQAGHAVIWLGEEEDQSGAL